MQLWWAMLQPCYLEVELHGVGLGALSGKLRLTKLAPPIGYGFVWGLRFEKLSGCWCVESMLT